MRHQSLARAGTAASGTLGGVPVVLLTGEPAGKISTTSAGVALLEATLCARTGYAPPSVLELHTPPPGARLRLAARETEPASSECRFSCEVRALRAGALAAALDGLLRALTAHAALADAVLEARYVRLAEPVVHPAPLVEALARDLWSAGFRVSFGPSWTAAPAGGAAVGIGGLEGPFECFLREHPAWCVASPPQGSGRASSARALDGSGAWG